MTGWQKTLIAVGAALVAAALAVVVERAIMARRRGIKLVATDGLPA